MLTTTCTGCGAIAESCCAAAKRRAGTANDLSDLVRRQGALLTTWSDRTEAAERRVLAVLEARDVPAETVALVKELQGLLARANAALARGAR